MKAVGIMKHGGPEVLEVLEVPEVQAGPGQIRIRNYAAAVNPTDVAARNGLMAEFQKKKPSSLCSRYGCSRNSGSAWRRS